MSRLPKFEHLYVMFAPSALPWRAKIGISIEAKQRKVQIEAELRRVFGYSVKVYAIGLPVLYAKQIEQRLHRVFDKMRYRGLQGTNGGTEWFWCPNILLCMGAIFVRYWFGDKYHLLPYIVVLFPIPLDIFFLTLLIAALQWSVIVAGIWGALWALNLY